MRDSIARDALDAGCLAEETKQLLREQAEREQHITGLCEQLDTLAQSEVAQMAAYCAALLRRRAEISTGTDGFDLEIVIDEEPVEKLGTFETVVAAQEALSALALGVECVVVE